MSGRRRVDAFGDPLPAGMRFRIGSERLSGDVASVLVLSPGGERVASASIEGWVTVWDARTGKQLRRMRAKKLPRTQARVEHLAFTPDGARLASTSSGRVVMWDLSTGKPAWETRLDHDFTFPVACSPDGRWVAAGGLLAQVALIDAATGAIVATLADRACSLAFSTDTRELYVAARRRCTAITIADRSVTRALDLAEDARSDELVVHARRDGSVVLVHLTDGVYEVDAARWQVTAHVPWPDGVRPFFAYRVASSDARVVASLGGKVRELARGATTWTELPGSEPEACALTPAGDQLALSARGAIGLSDGPAIPRVTGTIGLAMIDGVERLVTPEPGFVRMRDQTTGAVVAEHALPPGRVLVLDGAADRLVRREPNDDDHVHALDGRLVRPHAEARAHVFSPTRTAWIEKSYLGRGNGASLQLCDAQGARELYAGGATVYHVAFSPDGAHVAAGFYDRPGAIWSVADARHVADIPVEYIWTLAWSPDGTRILCAIHGGDVRIWDVAASRWALAFKPSRSMVKALAWAPDGRRFVTAGAKLALHDLEGVVRASWPGDVDDVAITSDGAGLVARRGDRVEVHDLDAAVSG